MSFADVVESRLIHKVQVAESTGQDDFGNPTVGTVREVDARIADRVRRVVNPRTGAELTSNTQFVTLEPVSPDSLVWLPGADTVNAHEARKPITVASAENYDGVRLYMVYL